MHSRFRERRIPLILAGLVLVVGCRGAGSGMANRSDVKAPAQDVADRSSLGDMGRDPSQAMADANGFRGAPSPRGAGVRESAWTSNGKPIDAPSMAAAGRGGAAARGSNFDPVAEHLAQGREELSRGNLDQAKLHFQRVLKDVPNHAEANHRLAVVADKQQNWPEADRHYRAALRARPNDPNLHSDFGYSLLLQQKYAEAERELQAALKVDGGHPRALNNLGLLYGRQGDYGRAYATFRRAGGDDEAQQKMARMFPEAPSAEILATSGAASPPNGMPTRIDSAGYQAETKLPPNPAAANQILAGIKARMEEERRRGEAAREQAQRRRFEGSPQRMPVPSEGAALAGWNENAAPYRRGHEESPDDFDVDAARQNGMRQPGLMQPMETAYGAGPQLGAPQYSHNRPELTSPLPAEGMRSVGMSPQSTMAARPVQIPESYMGRDRRTSEYASPAPPATGVVNAAGEDDVWPPRTTRRTPSPASIERAGYDQDRRTSPAGGARSSPLGPTPSQLESQRMATQIGMGAGPGGMFPYLDRPADTQPAGQGENNPYGGPYQRTDAAQAAPRDVPRQPPRSLPGAEGGGGYSQNFRGPRGDADNVDPRASNAGFGHGAMNGPPSLPPNGRTPMGPNAGWGMPPVQREWRDDEQPILGDPTSPPQGASAVNQSYQDHMNASGMAQDNPLYDPEHAAILNDIRREKQALASGQMQLGGGPDPNLQSGQYYQPLDPSMQPYETMRSEARAAAHADPNENVNMTRSRYAASDDVMHGGPNGYGNPDGLRGPAPRGAPAAGISPWGSSRGMDSYGPPPRKRY